jgi:hypothetical protein
MQMSVTWGKTELPEDLKPILDAAQSHAELRASARFIYVSVAAFLLAVAMVVIWWCWR